jgi:hypothetical protein
MTLTVEGCCDEAARARSCAETFRAAPGGASDLGSFWITRPASPTAHASSMLPGEKPVIADA